MAETKAVPLVDTHCHLDLYANPRSLIKKVEAARIYTIAVTNTPSVFAPLAYLTKKCQYIRPALGLHPELAIQRQGELSLMWKLLPQTRYIGEVGLDYKNSNHNERRRQRQIFSQIVDKCAASGDKILTIHSRGAANDVVDVLGESFKGVAILHWYSGSKRILEKALKYGCYFSINPAMIRSRKMVQLIEIIPPERLLTETDGPFVLVNKKPAVPADTARVVENIAKRWGRSTDQVRELLFANFKKILL